MGADNAAEAEPGGIPDRGTDYELNADGKPVAEGREYLQVGPAPPAAPRTWQCAVDDGASAVRNRGSAVATHEWHRPQGQEQGTWTLPCTE